MPDVPSRLMFHDTLFTKSHATQQKISSAICFDSLMGFNLGLLLFLHSEGTDKQLYRPNEHGV